MGSVVDGQDIVTVVSQDMATPFSSQRLPTSRDAIVFPRLKHLLLPKCCCLTHSGDRAGECTEVGQLIRYNHLSIPPFNPFVGFSFSIPLPRFH